MTARLCRALKAVRHLRGAWVFCDKQGERWSRGEIDAHLWRSCRRAGLRKLGWHSLRHTFCSRLAMLGAPARAIQELAGHASLTTTQRYMHLSPDARRAAIDLLEFGQQRGQQQVAAAEGGGN
jgi:site-specific recombinase XerD